MTKKEKGGTKFDQVSAPNKSRAIMEKELLYMLLWLSYKRTMNYNNSSIIRKHTRYVLKKRGTPFYINKY
jgi:hypothetical protein